MDKTVGSLDRKQYLIWNVFIVLGVLLFGLLVDSGKMAHSNVYWIISGIFYVLFIVFFIVAIARRLNNTGSNVWLALLALLPVIGVLLWLVLFFVPPKQKAKHNPTKKKFTLTLSV